jgi:LacI family transcriptional regulator
LAEHDVPLESSLIIEGTIGVDDTAAAVRPLLLRPDRPTALVAASMVVSIGAMRVLKDEGLEIPADMAFCVFDEPAYADLFRPRLTSVVQPAFTIGREAMRLLLRRLAHPDSPPRTVRLRPAIVHRESCGCPEGAIAEWEVMPTGERP